MKKIVKKTNLFAMLALMAVGGLTLAFTDVQTKDPQLYRKDATGAWTIPVTGQLGVDYECSAPFTEECTAELNEDNEPVNIMPGKYSE